MVSVLDSASLASFADLITGGAAPLAKPVSMSVTISSAITAFAATNLDDILLLLLFFSRLDRHFRARHVVLGQCLGFAVLLGTSLLGFAGRSLVPEAWLGLLGLLPISLGVSQLMERLDPESSQDASAEPAAPAVARTLGVADVTVANGSDNLGVYLPMFAHASAAELLLTLAVFVGMLGLWLGLAWRLVRSPGLAPLFARWGGPVIPFVLIGLGGLILLDSHTLDHRGLAVFALACLGVMGLSILRQLSALADGAGREAAIALAPSTSLRQIQPLTPPAP